MCCDVCATVTRCQVTVSTADNAAQVQLRLLSVRYLSAAVCTGEAWSFPSIPQLASSVSLRGKHEDSQLQVSSFIRKGSFRTSSFTITRESMANRAHASKRSPSDGAFLEQCFAVRIIRSVNVISSDTGPNPLRSLIAHLRSDAPSTSKSRRHQKA